MCAARLPRSVTIALVLWFSNELPRQNAASDGEARVERRRSVLTAGRYHHGDGVSVQ